MKNRILDTKMVKWRGIEPLQPDNAKLVFNYKDIEASLLKYGFAQPFYCWESEGIIYTIDGHTRKEVLSNMQGIPEELPAVFIDAKDRKEAIEILIEVYNQKHNPFDIEVLEELIEVEQLDVNLESVNVQISALNDEVGVLEAEEDDFDVNPPVVPKTVLGDLYEIGEHRLLCGDSTDSDQVAKLMNGEKADMVFTDPPYNVNYEGSNGLKIENDNKSDDDFYQFLYDAFLNYEINLKSGGAIYIAHADLEGLNFRKAFKDVGFKLRSTIIWNKNALVMGRSDYHWKHEPILYGWKEGASHQWNGDRKQTTVWECDKPKKNGEHPTMKPIELVSIAVNNSSKAKDLVLDLFLGSGSTMVASHQLKRKCYGMELDCRYADVIVKRMLKLDKTLKIKKNGIDETETWLKLIE